MQSFNSYPLRCCLFGLFFFFASFVLFAVFLGYRSPSYLVSSNEIALEKMVSSVNVFYVSCSHLENVVYFFGASLEEN